MSLKPGQIGLVNLTVKTKAKRPKEIIIKDIVFSLPYKGERKELLISEMEDRRVLKKENIKEDVTIIKIEVLKTLGFRNKQLDIFDLGA